jgi:hypothetical protein
MRYTFRQRVECAHPNVKAKPPNHQPASPIAPLQQEHSTYDSKYSNEGNERDPPVQWSFRKVIGQTYYACSYKQATQDRHWYRTLHGASAITALASLK